MDTMKRLFKKNATNQASTKNNTYKDEMESNDDSLTNELEKIDDLKLQIQIKNTAIMAKLKESVKIKKASILTEKKLADAETQLCQIRHELSEKCKQITTRDTELADLKKSNKRLMSELTEKSKNLAKNEKTFKEKNEELESLKVKLKQEEHKVKELITTHKKEIKNKDKRIKELEKITQKSRKSTKAHKSQIGNSTPGQESSSILKSTSNESLKSNVKETLPVKEVLEKTELVNEIGDSSRNNEKTKSMSEVNEKKENGGTEEQITQKSIAPIQVDRSQIDNSTSTQESSSTPKLTTDESLRLLILKALSTIEDQNDKNLSNETEACSQNDVKTKLMKEAEEKEENILIGDTRLAKLDAKGVSQKVITVADSRSQILMKEEEIKHWRETYDEMCLLENTKCESKKCQFVIDCMRKKYTDLYSMYKSNAMESKIYCMHIAEQSKEIEAYLSVNMSKEKSYIELKNAKKVIRKLNREVREMQQRLSISNDKLKVLKERFCQRQLNGMKQKEITDLASNYYKSDTKDLAIYLLQKELWKCHEDIQDKDEKLIAHKLELVHYKMWTKNAITVTLLNMPDWLSLYEKMYPDAFENILRNLQI